MKKRSIHTFATPGTPPKAEPSLPQQALAAFESGDMEALGKILAALVKAEKAPAAPAPQAKKTSTPARRLSARELAMCAELKINPVEYQRRMGAKKKVTK